MVKMLIVRLVNWIGYGWVYGLNLEWIIWWGLYKIKGMGVCCVFGIFGIYVRILFMDLEVCKFD